MIAALLDRLAGAVRVDWWAFAHTQGAFRLPDNVKVVARRVDDLVGEKSGPAVDLLVWQPWAFHWPSVMDPECTEELRRGLQVLALDIELCD